MAGLPSMPSSCAALHRVLDDESAGVEAIAEIVAADVGMSAKPEPLAGWQWCLARVGWSATRATVVDG